MKQRRQIPFPLRVSCFSSISEAGAVEGVYEVCLESTCLCVAVTSWVLLYSYPCFTLEDAELRRVGPPVQWSHSRYIVEPVGPVGRGHQGRPT